MFENIKNVAQMLSAQAKEIPERTAIANSKAKLFGGFSYPSYDFKTADSRVNGFCQSLAGHGVKQGDKVLFFVTPNLDFSLITFALFRIGAIPVFIDPGMKRSYFFECIEEVNPRVLIGIPKAILMAKTFKDKFKSVEVFISTSKISFLGKSIFKGFNIENEYETFIPSEQDLAAILYTSGGTGKPKGVEYTHSIFINQTRMLKEEFSLTKEDIDIPGFPLFSFFTLAMGMKSVVPCIDFSNPIQCDPSKLVKNINDNKATFLAGSPAIWLRVANYCLQENIKLHSVKYIVMFGAPVPVSLHKKLAQVLTNGTTYTPYGATECLPITNISGEFILKNTAHLTLKGGGVCVGKPLKGVKLLVVNGSEEADSVDINKPLGINEIGEIIVSSPNVTKRYYQNEDATKISKINDNGILWHRMGDVGYLDGNGLLWFCGRKKHVVSSRSKKYYPAQVENIFNQHPKVDKCALIFNKNNNKPALVINRKDSKSHIESMFLMDLKNIAQTNSLTQDINEFYVDNQFPVDVRHNIKIDRVQLQNKVLGE